MIQIKISPSRFVLDKILKSSITGSVYYSIKGVKFVSCFSINFESTNSDQVRTVSYTKVETPSREIKNSFFGFLFNRLKNTVFDCLQMHGPLASVVTILSVFAMLITVYPVTANVIDSVATSISNVNTAAVDTISDINYMIETLFEDIEIFFIEDAKDVSGNPTLTNFELEK